MVNETIVTLNIYDCQKDITEILDIEASVEHEKNELISKNGTIKYKNSAWIYKLSANNITDIELLLSNIVSIFQSSKDKLKTLAQEYDIEISIVSYMREGVPSFHFSKEFVKFIYEIDCEVDLDLYYME